MISIAQAEWVLVAHALLQVPDVQKLGRWRSMTTAVHFFPLARSHGAIAPPPCPPAGGYDGLRVGVSSVSSQGP